MFETDGHEIRHDDAILVAKSWEDLALSTGAQAAPRLDAYEARARRAESLRRIADRKGLPGERLETEHVHPLKEDYDYLAPDGSEIRELVSSERGGFAHCVLPAGRTSSPVRHRTVEELWYVLEGAGEVWRGREGEPPRIDPVAAGDSLRIPVGVAFQFRAGNGGALKLLLATIPRWPGAKEAVAAVGGLDATEDACSK